MMSSDFEAYRQAKEQIAQLEAEMAEFRASSRELEQELELELEESEERHKSSQMKINQLTLELDQVKVCIYCYCKTLFQFFFVLGGGDKHLHDDPFFNENINNQTFRKNTGYYRKSLQRLNHRFNVRSARFRTRTRNPVTAYVKLKWPTMIWNVQNGK